MRKTMKLIFLVVLSVLRRQAYAQDEEVAIESSSASVTSEDVKIQLQKSVISSGTLPENVRFAGDPSNPALEFTGGATIGKRLDDVFPDEFFGQFLAIGANINPSSSGYLFSITDASQSNVLIGLELTSSSLELHLRDDTEKPFSISFKVPNFEGTWKKFVVTVSDDQAQLHFNGPSVSETKDLTSVNREFPNDAKVFLAGRGSTSGQYEGQLTEIVVVSTSDLHSVVTDYFGEISDHDDVDEEGSGSGAEDGGLEGDTESGTEIPDLTVDDEDGTESSGDEEEEFGASVEVVDKTDEKEVTDTTAKAMTIVRSMTTIKTTTATTIAATAPGPTTATTTITTPEPRTTTIATTTTREPTKITPEPSTTTTTTTPEPTTTTKATTTTTAAAEPTPPPITTLKVIPTTESTPALPVFSTDPDLIVPDLEKVTEQPDGPEEFSIPTEEEGETISVLEKEGTVTPPTVSVVKGEKGEPGVGILGMKGEPGDAGAAGPPGEQGLPGLVGSKGDTGTQGKTGEKGESGVNGRKGEPGESVTGAPGAKGQPGESVQGPIGPQGPRGEKGEPGDDVVGEPGPPGPPGEFDVEDLADFSGLNDLEGPRGPPGPPGLPGPAGAHGEQGEPGISGAPGKAGPAGRDGENGAVGATGPVGQKGDSGKDGAAGAPGPPGPPGICFARPGVNQFSDDEDLDVSSGEDGEHTNGCGGVGPVGPQGPVGPPGPTGSQGPPGVPGPTGTHGTDGLDGKDGQTGAVGPKGDTGAPGPAGLRGLQGVGGEQGQKGDSGMTGVPGTPGNQGDPGERGEKGETGEQGPPGPPGPQIVQSGDQGAGQKGAKGEPGAMLAPDGTIAGSQGDKGDMGMPGHRGEKGEIGPVGPPGPPGPPGAGRPVVGGTEGPQGEPGLTGPVGARGPPGPPGPAGIDGRGYPGPPGRDGISVRTFASMDELRNSYHTVADGSLGYTSDHEELFLRTPSGWRQVYLGSSVTAERESLTTIEATTELELERLETTSATRATTTTTHPTTTKTTARPTTTTATTTTTRPTTATATSVPVTPAAITHSGKRLRLVALNYPIRGNMGGIAGADHKCYRQARKQGLNGTYRAFLSSRDQHVKSIVHRNYRDSVPIVNIRNEPLFSSWNDLVASAGRLGSEVPVYSFDNTDVMASPRWPTKIMWHGSKPSGQVNTMHNCANWRTFNLAVTGQASILKNGDLLGQHTFSCSTQLIVLCIENSASSWSYKR